MSLSFATKPCCKSFQNVVEKINDVKRNEFKIIVTCKCIYPSRAYMSTSTSTPIVIEAWIQPLSSLTPSLIVHNLELQGIQLPQPFAVTVDRGHYDCTDFNYAVITVSASSAATTTATTATTTTTVTVPLTYC